MGAASSGMARGAAAGSVAGPWGTVVGGLAGGIWGGIRGSDHGGELANLPERELRQIRHRMRDNPQAVAHFDQQLAASRDRVGAPGGTESNDLATRRRDALDRLEQETRNPTIPQLRNDPAAGINYNRPTVAPRDTSLFDRATSMTRPDGTIANDAIDELRGRGEFSYADRPAMQMHGDPLEEIRNFRGQASDIAAQYASGGIGGGAGGGGYEMSGVPGVSAGQVEHMTERASVDELMNFDADGAFNRYMEGAKSAYGTELNDANRRLTATAAGRGRLNTGFFDQDSGELSRQITNDWNNNTKQAALQTNQQKLDATTSGTQIRATDLNNLRDQFLTASRDNARNGLDASIANASNTVAMNRMGVDRMGIDADFRLGALGALGKADQLRFDSLTSARDYMVGDRDRIDKNFETDREFSRGSFNDYNDRLVTVGNTQRADRTRTDNLFNTDREFLMGADRQRNDYYENDRDYNLDSWDMENRNRIAGGTLARGDREFEYGAGQSAWDRYLDMLSANSDRAQGAQNAANTNRVNAQNSRNDLWGTLAGAVGGYFGSRRTSGSTNRAVTRAGTTNNGPVNA